MLAIGLSGCSGMSSTPPASPVASGATVIGSKNPSPGSWSPDSYVYLIAIDGQPTSDGYRDWAMRRSLAPGAHTLDVGLTQRTFMGGDDAHVQVRMTAMAGETYRLRATEPDPSAANAPAFVWLENSRGEPVSERATVTMRTPPTTTTTVATPDGGRTTVTVPDRGPPPRPGARIGSPFGGITTK